jgi:hypothetical protein
MQIIWITNYFCLLLVGVHKLSNTSILVQIPTKLTVHCSVSSMSCWAIRIMWRPSSNLLQRYFLIQIFLIGRFIPHLQNGLGYYQLLLLLTMTTTKATTIASDVEAAAAADGHQLERLPTSTEDTMTSFWC